jgi:hypothetical protein
MKITNAYQAILAKLGGNNDVNIPAPRNKYEKLLNDISENGGSDGGSSMVVRITNNGSNFIADKTFDEVYNAMVSGTHVVAMFSGAPTHAIFLPNSQTVPNGPDSPEPFAVSYLQFTGLFYDELATIWIVNWDKSTDSISLMTRDLEER